MRRWAWLLPVACAGLVFLPITGNYFHADDFVDLYQLRNEDVAHYLLRMYGGHVLIARNSVTLLLHAVFGVDPRGYFAVALLTHLLNVALLYGIALRLTDSWRLASVGAAMWGVAPANEGALGWYAVYGQVVATTCILLVLAGLLARRVDDTDRLRPVGWALLLVVAGTCFGIGIAAALVMPVVAWLLLPPVRARRAAIAWLVAAALAVLAIYATLRWLEPMLYGEHRMETAVMVAGIPSLSRHALLLATLLAIGLAQWPIATLATPMTFPSPLHLVALAGSSVLLLAGLAAARAPARRRLGAVLLLALAMYGLIAVGRSAFEAHGTIALAQSLRYHYAAGALLSVALVAAVRALAARWNPSTRLANRAWAAWAAALLAMLALTPHTIEHFDPDRRETAAALATIRQRIGAAPPGAPVAIPIAPFYAVGSFNVAFSNLFPGTAGLFVIFYPDNVVDGHRVTFTSSDPKTLEAARGRRGATLIDLPASGAAAKDSPP
jgi:hypothetical protein